MSPVTGRGDSPMSREEIVAKCEERIDAIPIPKLREWLRKTTSFKLDTLSAEETAPLWWKICHLVVWNGGFTVYGWGIINSGLTRFREGLHQDEAFELMQLTAFLGGVNLMDNTGTNALDAVNAVVNEFFLCHAPSEPT